jgi:hypothetical protein
MKTDYIQGETITPSATDATAQAVVFKWWPTRSTAAVTAAKSLIGSLKSQVTVGEISTTDKTAEEISALDAILKGGVATRGGSVALEKAGETWTAAIDTSAMYGEYGYVVLATSADGTVKAIDNGTIRVEGDPEAADVGGCGIFTIGTRFC